MRRTKDEADITRQNILSAALQVFSRKGYSATRVEDIAKTANVTTGAIYHHFSGKSDLYVALIEKNSTKINLVAKQVVDEGGTPATILRRLLVLLFEFIEQDEEYKAVVELFLNQTKISSELAVISEQVLESRRLLAENFSGLIREGIELGEFKASVPPDDAALALVGFMNGMGLIWVQDPEFFSISDRAQSLVDSFLSGILADS